MLSDRLQAALEFTIEELAHIRSGAEQMEYTIEGCLVVEMPRWRLLHCKLFGWEANGSSTQ